MLEVCKLKNTNVAVIRAGYCGKKIVDECSQLAESNSNVNLFAVCDLSMDKSSILHRNQPNRMKMQNAPEWLLNNLAVEDLCGYFF
jgi:hypothetical protein